MCATVFYSATVLYFLFGILIPKAHPFRQSFGPFGFYRRGFAFVRRVVKDMRANIPALHIHYTQVAHPLSLGPNRGGVRRDGLIRAKI